MLMPALDITSATSLSMPGSSRTLTTSTSRLLQASPAASRVRAALSGSFGTNWMKPSPSRLAPWIASILTRASPRILPRRARVPGVSCNVTLNSTAISLFASVRLDTIAPGPIFQGPLAISATGNPSSELGYGDRRYTPPDLDRFPPGTQPPSGGRFSHEDNHRGCGGAGGRGGGRRGGRVGFGRGGAGAVFRRSQPSRFWREPRPLIG